MSSNEEYLENLLQSMMNGETPAAEPDAGKQKSALELLSGEGDEQSATDMLSNMDDIFAAADVSLDGAGFGDLNESGMDDLNLDGLGLDDLNESGMGDLSLDGLGLDDLNLNESGMGDLNLDGLGLDDLNESGMDDLNLDALGFDDFNPNAGETAMQDFSSEEAQMDDELAALLGMGGMTAGESGMDSDMAEIDGFLEQSGQEDDDMMSLLGSVSDSSSLDLPETDAMDFLNAGGMDAAPAQASESAGEATESEDKKKKRKKEKKPRKERKSGKQTKEEQNIADADGNDTEKQKGIFAKFLDFLMEEDEEEEEKGTGENPDEMDLLLGETSNENQQLLDELSEEDKKKKGKDKKKKDKKAKKGKKNQKDQDAASDENEEEGTGEESAKAKKKKKPKKAKKNKEETEDNVNAKPEKKLSKKKVIPVILFCATIGVAIVVLSSVIPSFLQKRDAQVAYDLGNYAEAYDLLYDEDLGEDDEVILMKSRIILQMQRKLDVYETYQKMSGKELESLNVLIQGVSLYHELLPKADEYYVTGEISDIYRQILEILSEKYGLSEASAAEIADCDDNVAYTEYLRTIVYGGVYENAVSEEEAESTADILPEEQEILDKMSAE